MLSRECEIKNEKGIHARPASLFVKTASMFDSDVTVEKDGSTVSVKNVMDLLTLEARKGTRLIITTSGPDEEEALDDLQALIENNFMDE